MSINVVFDPILGKLRQSDVGVISLASGASLPDPIIINNIQVASAASTNLLNANNIYASTISTGNLTANNIANHSTISTNLINANSILASTATLGYTHISTIDWNLTSGVTLTVEGQMNWDANQQTAVIGMAGGNVDLALGMEQLFPRRVRNSTGSTMAKGTVVYINGVSGNTPTVERAIATSDMTSAFTLGMTAEDIANTATGWVTTFGEITGINLSAYTGGDTLYLSGATAGAFTNIPQLAPKHYVRVGTVVKATTDGALVVNVINGYELNELHNVVITSLASGQILQSGVSNLWYNITPGFIPTASYPSLGSLAVLNDLSYTSLLNKPSLGSLSVLNDFSYTSLLNKPSLGSLALLNDLSYTSLLNLPSLGSLAVLNDFSYVSLLNKPSLGSLAEQNTVDYVTQVTSKPSLGSLAVLNDLSFTSLTNQPSLGSLAPLNSVTQEYLPATVSFTSLFVNSTRTNDLAVPSTASIRLVRATNIIGSNATISGTTNSTGVTSNFILTLNATVSLNLGTKYLGAGGGNGVAGVNAPINVENNQSVNNMGYGIYINSLSSTLTAGDNIGGFFQAEDRSGGVKTIYGHRARGYFNPQTAGLTLSGLQATSNQAVIQGGTVNYVETLTTNADIDNAYVGELRLLRFFNPNIQANASVGILVGMELPDFTAVHSNPYSIYADGGKSYHKGNFGFGTITNPQTQIHYSGVMTGDGAVFASTVSTNILNTNSALFVSQVSIQTLDISQLNVNSAIFASQVSIRNLNGNNVFFNDGTIQNFNANSVNSGTGTFSGNVAIGGSLASQALYINATNTTYGRTAINYPSTASNNSWVGYTFTVNDGTYSGGLYRRVDNADIGIWTQGSGATPRMVVANNGRVGVNNTVPLGLMHVDQNSTTAAIPTLELNQDDLSEEFINFVSTIGVGNPIQASSTVGTLTHKVRVAVNGTFRLLYLYSS